MKLYKIQNGIGSYWVVANHPTEAEDKLMDILNKNDYGFSTFRKTISIEVIAEAVADKFISGKFLVL